MDIFVGDKKSPYLLDKYSIKELKYLYRVPLFPSIYLTIICMGPIGSLLFKIYDGKVISRLDKALVIFSIALLIGNWISFYYDRKKWKKRLDFVIQDIEQLETKEKVQLK